MSVRDLPTSPLAQLCKGLRALRILDPLTLDEWAEKHFCLSAESAQVAPCLAVPFTDAEFEAQLERLRQMSDRLSKTLAEYTAYVDSLDKKRAAAGLSE